MILLFRDDNDMQDQDRRNPYDTRAPLSHNGVFLIYTYLYMHSPFRIHLYIVYTTITISIVLYHPFVQRYKHTVESLVRLKK